jgi:hypothetical protein
VLDRAARVTLPAGEPATSLETRAVLDDEVEAPVRMGERVGKLVISRFGRDLAEFPLVAGAPVERAPSLLLRIATSAAWFLCGGLLSLGVFTLLRFRQLRRKARLRARRARSAAAAPMPAPRLVKAGSAVSQLVR